MLVLLLPQLLEHLRGKDRVQGTHDRQDRSDRWPSTGPKQVRIDDENAEDEHGKYLRIRTFERGVEGETLACGTGCISSAIIAHATKAIDSTSIRLLTQSGEFVTVAFDLVDGKAQNLSLEGSAKRGMKGVLSFDEASGEFSFRS